MVISVLVNLYAPTSRGLRRAETTNNPSWISNNTSSLSPYGTHNFSSYNNSSRRHRQRQHQQQQYDQHNHRNRNSPANKAWTKIRNATKVSTALRTKTTTTNTTNHHEKRTTTTTTTRRRSVLDTNTDSNDGEDDDDDDENDNDDDTITSNKIPTYDERYYALSRQHQQPQVPLLSSNHPHSTSSPQLPMNDNHHNHNNNYNTRDGLMVSTTMHRRKRFRAITLVTSIAADLEMITDWIFYGSAILAERRYDQNWLEQYGGGSSGNNNTSTNNNRNMNENDDDNYNNNNNMQSSGGASSTDIPPPKFLIPPIFMYLLLASCLIGTFMWSVVASDGRMIAPFCRYLGVDQLSMGFILFICVLIEDIPQIILTFLIEDYYEEGRSFSSYAMCNIVISFYDMLLKLAEAYDERNDIVETGAWCKLSLPHAHTRTITAVTIVPPTSLLVTTTERFSTSSKQTNSNTNQVTSNTSILPDSESIRDNTLVTTEYNHMGTDSKHENHQYTSPSTLSLPSITNRTLDELCFLTASLDKKIRLWATTKTRTRTLPASSSTSRKWFPWYMYSSCTNLPTTSSSTTISKECIKVFDDGHPNKDEITCLTILGTMDPTEYERIGNLSSYYNHYYYLSSTNQQQQQQRRKKGDEICTKETKKNTYFLTGCQEGITKLWNLQGSSNSSVREYDTGEKQAVTAVTVMIEGLTFVTGYINGSARLWDAWTGTCIAIYKVYQQSVYGTICCSLEDDVHLLTGSAELIQLWDTSSAMKLYCEYQQQTYHNTTSTSTNNNKEGRNTTTFPTVVSFQPLLKPYLISERVFRGHTDTVRTLCCLEPSVAFLSGSNDGTARLWSVETGQCLRVFVGHTNAVTVVRVVDNVTFLTGSSDSFIRLWDVVSGSLIRVYQGHQDEITDISIADDDTSFVTTSMDLCAKLWVLTADIPPVDTIGTDNGMMFQTNHPTTTNPFCHGFDPL